MRSLKASAMATSLTSPAVLSAWLAAPEPRPPQPTSATLIVSLDWANAPRSMDKLPNATALPAIAELDLRKPRRSSRESFFWVFLLCFIRRFLFKIGKEPGAA